MRLSLFALFFLLINSLYAQVDNFESYKNSYQDGINNETQKYNNFTSKKDSAFVNYLKDDWSQFELFTGIKADILPGPEKIPVFNNQTAINGIERIPPTQIEIETESTPIVYSQPIIIPIVDPYPTQIDYKFTKIDFFGVSLGVNFDKLMILEKTYNANASSIAEFWEYYSNTKYSNLIEQLLSYKSNRNLNDWAYYLLVKDVSKHLDDNSNNQCLITWFLLTKSGYKTKIGFSDDTLHLLIPFAQQVYGMSYYTFNKLPYYVLDGNTESIYT